MNVAGFVASLIIPAVLGYGWVSLFWQRSHIAARLGYGYLLGVFATTLVIYAYGKSGFSLGFLPIASLLLILMLIPFFLVWRRTSMGKVPPMELKHDFLGGGYQYWLWLFVIVFIGARVAGYITEEMLRPLYPWDAWMNWAPRSKVWFELKELAPFVHYSVWQKESMEGAYLLANPDAFNYPPLVPLLQLWNALGLNMWRDNWINISWAGCVLAFALAFYGQLRMLRFGSLASVVITWMLISLPYLGTHAALAGYADIWLSAFYCAAVMALINWTITGSRAQLLLAVLMALACVFTKKPGMIWAATLLPGFFLATVPVQMRYVALGGAAALLLLVMTVGVSLYLPGGHLLVLTSELVQIPGVGKYMLDYHPVGESFVKNCLWYNNWNVLGWLILCMAPIALVRSFLIPRLLPGAVTVSSGVMFIIVVFFFTHHFKAALDSTTINRALFHIVPAILYFSVVAIFWKGDDDFGSNYKNKAV
ncbi:hypothetical protein [Thiolapillus sp.]